MPRSRGGSLVRALIEMRRAGVSIGSTADALWLVLPASAKERHQTIMGCAAGHFGVAAIGGITADEQGDFEPHQRGFVVPVFPAFSRPLQGDERGRPAVSVGEHVGQPMQLRRMIHGDAMPWSCRGLHVGRRPRSGNAREASAGRSAENQFGSLLV
jgi:hypothetical protein